MALPVGFLTVGEDLGDGDESSRLRAVIQIYWWYSCHQRMAETWSAAKDSGDETPDSGKTSFRRLIRPGKKRASFTGRRQD